MSYQKIFYPGLVSDEDAKQLMSSTVWPLTAGLCLKSQGRLKVVKAGTNVAVLGAVGYGGFPCIELTYLRHDCSFQFKNWFHDLRKTPKKNEAKRRVLKAKKDTVLAKKILKPHPMGMDIISEIVEQVRSKVAIQLRSALERISELDKAYGNTRSQPTHTIGDEEMVDLMAIVFQERTPSALSAARLERFKAIKDTVDDRHTRRQQQYVRVKEFFNDDLTVLAYNTGIECYMLGRIHCEVDGLRTGKISTTQPFAAYKTLSDIPPEQREPLLRDLTMHKVHFQQDRNREYADPADYMPTDDCLFDEMNAISYSSAWSDSGYTSPFYLMMRYAA